MTDSSNTIRSLADRLDALAGEALSQAATLRAGGFDADMLGHIKVGPNDLGIVPALIDTVYAGRKERMPDWAKVESPELTSALQDIVNQLERRHTTDTEGEAWGDPSHPTTPRLEAAIKHLVNPVSDAILAQLAMQIHGSRGDEK